MSEVEWLKDRGQRSEARGRRNGQSSGGWAGFCEPGAAFGGEAVFLEAAVGFIGDGAFNHLFFC